jgi:hypothetical protein
VTFSDAAIAAIYPVLVILGMTIWARYLPLIAELQAGVRTLVCSLLMMVTTIIAEQVYYGFGRFTGEYAAWVQNYWVIAVLKLGYVSSFSYMLYAFWMLAPVKPRLVVPFLISAAIWSVVTVALMF